MLDESPTESDVASIFAAITFASMWFVNNANFVVHTNDKKKKRKD